MDQGFKEYRNRVIDRFGKGLDRELKYDIKAETIQEKITDEKGKEKTVEKTSLIRTNIAAMLVSMTTAVRVGPRMPI